MRTRKLSKSTKGKGNVVADDWIIDPDLTFRASLDDLKSQTSRQSLRQHFTGAFPETQLRPSLELGDEHTTPKMRSRGRLPRQSSDLNGSNESVEMTSSSTTSVNSTEMKRLSTVRESSVKIDIAEMVVMLQELSQTASPAELVALHKALQTRKDSAMAPSPASTPPVEDKPTPPPRSPFVRRRSMLPPGVATRNASGAPLRTPEEASAILERPRPRTEPTPKNELSALDLPNDNPSTMHRRSSTPIIDLDSLHMGAYRPGTLRVINGRASPEPSLLLKDAQVGLESSTSSKLPEDYETAPTTPERGNSLKLRPSNSDTAPIRETIITYTEKQRPSTKLSVKTSNNDPPANSTETRRASEPTMPCSLKPKKDEVHPLRALKTTPFQRISMTRGLSRERAHSEAEQAQNRNESRMIRTADSSPMKMRNENSFQPSTNTSSRQSLEPNATNVVEEKRSSANAPVPQANEQLSRTGSRTGMPRFAQRWSHRLSHLSTEPSAEAQLPSNPFEDNSALHSLSKRLSTVTDRTIRERQESSARETPEVALAKLTGEIEHPIYKQTEDGLQADATQSPISSAENLPETRSRRSSQPQKTDSGYGSDAVPVTKDLQKAKVAGNGDVYTIAEQTHKAYEGLSVDDDAVSLYSFNQVLKSPYLLSGLAMPSPPSARGSKKHLSLLGINKTISDDPDASGDHVIDPFPVQEKPVRTQKKLQKPMPASVRNSIKSAMTRKDERRRSKIVMTPDLHDDLEDTFAEYCDTEDSRIIVARLPDSRRVSETEPITEPAVATEGAIDGTNIDGEVSAPGLHGTQVIYECRVPHVKSDMIESRPLNLTQESSASRNRSGSTTPRASQFEPGPMSCFNGSGRVEKESTRTARGPLTSHPPTPSTATFNPSTKLLNRTVSVPEGQQVRGYRASFRRSRNFGVPGTQPEMVSESSRRHSRAMAKQKNEEILESFGFIPSMPKRRSKVDSKPAADSKDPSKTKQLPPLPASENTERPGDSTESIADVIRKAAEARKARNAAREGDHHKPRDSRDSRPRRSRRSKREEATGDELEGSSSEDLRLAFAEEQQPNKDAGGQQSSDWERHAETWRHQRELLEHKLGTPSPLSGEQADGVAPRIVVSEPISPRTNNNGDNRAVPSPFLDSAEVQARQYRDLVNTDGLNQPTGGSDAQQNSNEPAEEHNVPKAETETTNDSAYTVKSYHSDAPQIERSRSPGGRVVTPSGHFHPYSTANATEAGSTISPKSDQPSRRSLPPTREPLDSLIDRYGGGRVVPRQSAVTKEKGMRLKNAAFTVQNEA